LVQSKARAFRKPQVRRGGSRLARLRRDFRKCDNAALGIRDDVPVPRLGVGEVLIAVGACGMNNTDINTRIGWYSKTVSAGTTTEGAAGGMADMSGKDATWGFGALDFPRIQGADVAGRIVAAGEGVLPDRVGERVLVDPWLRDKTDPANRNLAGYLGSERDGGFAQYVCVPEENAFPINSDYSDTELATFPCSYSTAEHMLTRVGVKTNDKILIPGASGGVGSALVQLAKRRGAWILALTSRGKMDQATALGVDAVLDRTEADLEQRIRKMSPGGELDVVADVVGGDSFPMYLSLLCRGGRYVTSGAIAGPMVALDLRELYLKDLQMHGATVMPVGIFANLVRYIEKKEIRPLLADQFPIQNLKEAQERFLEKKHFGNFSIRPS